MDLSISFPLVRIRITKHESPRAASQAPNLSRVKIEMISEGLFFDVIIGIVKHSERIIASSARSDMRRCFR